MRQDSRQNIVNWVRDSFVGRIWIELFWLRQNDRGFLAAALVVIIGSGLTFVSLLRIWPSTPEGMDPIVKISLIDYVQARSLSRKAAKDEQAGNIQGAKAAWMLAVANDPGEPYYLRQVLSMLRQQKASVDLGQQGVMYGSWLLQLTATNQTDLIVVAETLEHGRRFADALNLLLPYQSELLPAARAVQLRCLFHLGRYQDVCELWNTVGEELSNDSLLRLYSLASRAILGPDEKNYVVFDGAFSAYPMEAPDYVLAQQAALRVLALLGHSTKAQALLLRLKAKKQATLRDFLFFYSMLIREGHAGILKGANWDAADPVTETEALSLIKMLHLAGLRQEARELNVALLDRFINFVPLWLNHGDSLVVEEDWGALKSLANQIQANSRLAGLWSAACYWEGIAEWYLGNRERGREAFREISGHPSVSRSLTVEIANRLSELGEKPIADEIIQSLDRELHGVRGFWISRGAQAVREKNLEEFSKVAITAYASDPEFIPYINNYVASLLLERKEPQRALALSARLLEADRQALPFRLTRVHALIQNGKLEEAAAVLGNIELHELRGPLLEADYQLALLELAIGEERWSDAATLRKSMKLDVYLPETVRWITDSVERGVAQNPLRLGSERDGISRL